MDRTRLAGLSPPFRKVERRAARSQMCRCWCKDDAQQRRWAGNTQRGKPASRPPRATVTENQNCFVGARLLSMDLRFDRCRIGKINWREAPKLPKRELWSRLTPFNLALVASRGWRLRFRKIAAAQPSFRDALMYDEIQHSIAST